MCLRETSLDDKDEVGGGSKDIRDQSELLIYPRAEI